MLSMSVCLSVCPLAYLRNHSAELLCMLTVAVARSFSDNAKVCLLCTSGFLDDAMFSHNGLYGMSSIFLSGERIA